MANVDSLEEEILSAPKTKGRKAAKKAPKKVKAEPEVDPLMADFKEVQLTEVSIQQLENKIQQWAEERTKYEEAKAEASRLKEVADNTGEWLKSFMSENKKSSYHSAWGRLQLAKRFSVKFPTDLEAKQRLFEYLRDREGAEGLDSLLSIHSGKFNKIYKEYLEAAKEEGQPDFEIPGVGSPTTMEVISLVKR